jgi:hypothetical protein
VIARQHLVVGERKHRAAAALAGFDLELAPGRRPDNEVLQETERSDARCEFGIGCGIGMLANIAGWTGRACSTGSF